ncbi:MAG: TauD/TfdA family dioxygenase [Proteobacteria bacterium]|nr:TauD/TfdA family dioxygenase [Pseudomonadota bacterium]
MSLHLRPLHPLFAAEATGVDLRTPIDDPTLAGIVAALDRYAVLVLPGQALSDAQQMDFSARLGPLETTIKAYRPDHKARLDLHISDVSNLDENNRVMAPDDRRRMNGLGNRLWHTDSSFKAIPARYSLLSARAIPGAGGETEFADLRAAWDALPDAMQRRVEGLVAEHSILHSRASIGFTDFSAEERARLQPVPQTLVRTHPGSGRKTLYLASHAGSIRGMALPKARLLLLDLMEHATQRAFVYTHRWRLHDLVIWDDRCTMHRAREYDASVPRDMHRTTVSDGVSTLAQAGLAA